MYRKIMVPVDGSPTSNLGLAHAMALARDQGAELLLVHVVEALPMLADPSAMMSWAEIQDSMRTEGAAMLTKLGAQAKAEGARASTVLRDAGTGLVADTLVQEAKATGCDLIVMGTHGRRGVRHLVMGSDAEAVVRHAPVPVLLVRDTQGG